MRNDLCMDDCLRYHVLDVIKNVGIENCMDFNYLKKNTPTVSRLISNHVLDFNENSMKSSNQ